MQHARVTLNMTHRQIDYGYQRADPETDSDRPQTENRDSYQTNF